MLSKFTYGLRSQYCDEWELISGLEVIAKMLLLEDFIILYIYIPICREKLRKLCGGGGM